jgi:D-alanyl-D-alanine carboxypeptidase/D-alanyl-D-alanine-endopeptidase (penicillin-binding protein 4)
MYRWAVIAGFALLPQLMAAPPLPERINEVLQRPEYRHARWGLLFADAKSGSVVFEKNANEMFVPASTTKLYSCSAALAELGPDYRFRTKVVARGEIADGTLNGDLILVASGDLTMDGRTLPDGTMAFADSDHTYADATATTPRLTATDPLAGLKHLAAAIRNRGIRRITGDVLIDDRLFASATGSGSGPSLITPIIVNDNVVDFVITNGPEGIRVRMVPETSYVRFEHRITIDDAAKPIVSVVADGHRAVTIRGHLPRSTKELVRAWPVDDPAGFARVLLIECLEKQAIEVDASRFAGPKSALPDQLSVSKLSTVAELVSPPLSEATKVTLKVSHNLYASTLPLLIAVKHGQRTLANGLGHQRTFLQQLGVPLDQVSFAGGAGGAPADSTTPRATVELLRRLRERPEYPAFELGLPILGIDGSLADLLGKDSPARGKVKAKTGTLNYGDLMNDRTLLRSKALAGVMTTRSGRELVFAMFVNNVPLPKGVGSSREGEVLARLCEIVVEDE